MGVGKLLPIFAYAQPVYKKCECCGRVRDIYYRMHVMDPKDTNLLVGSIELCEPCGEKLGSITDQKLAKETVLAKFAPEDDI